MPSRHNITKLPWSIANQKVVLLCFPFMSCIRSSLKQKAEGTVLNSGVRYLALTKLKLYCKFLLSNHFSESPFGVPMHYRM